MSTALAVVLATLAISLALASWLSRRMARPLVRLADAARLAGLSPFHFLRVFAAVVGVTPHQYVMRLRLARAAKLLCDGTLRVTDVALEAGFADLSHFVRTFARAAGVPPLGSAREQATATRLDCPAANPSCAWGGKVLITGGIGHNLPQEAPAAFADAVLDVQAL